MFKIDYAKSHGSYLVDTKGKEYIDFVNHYASNALGYNHPALGEEFKEEVCRVAQVKTSVGIYDSNEFQEFLKEFKDFAMPKGYSHVHFACTGSLAIEAAVKTMNCNDNRVMNWHGGFHGINSFGNWFSKNRRTIQPFSQGGNEYEDCADIIEPIRCSHGDRFEEIDNRGRLFILDEIQTGFGTTGKVWYHEHLGIKPDIIVFGKKAQVSGIIVKDKYENIFKDKIQAPNNMQISKYLSVTWDGDLIDMIRCKYIIRAILEDNLMDNIRDCGAALLSGLLEIGLSARGIGGIVAFDCKDSEKLGKQLEKKGLLTNYMTPGVVRLRPNLNVALGNVEEVVRRIKKAI